MDKFASDRGHRRPCGDGFLCRCANDDVGLSFEQRQEVRLCFLLDSAKPATVAIGTDDSNFGMERACASPYLERMAITRAQLSSYSLVEEVLVGL